MDSQDEVAPSYYPPRARWWSPIFYPWFRIQRALHLEQLHCPAGFTAVQTALGLAVPGFSFCALGRRILGLSVLGVYCASIATFIVRLGFGSGSFAYGLLLAAHAASAYYLMAYWMSDMEFGLKLALAGGCLLIVWGVLYHPLIGFCERHWFLPMNIRGQVVVMQPRPSSQNIHRGDRILYRMTAAHNALVHNQAVYIRGGLGWGPVLALPGDHVVFSTNSFSVNGTDHPLLDHMPVQGDIQVPQKQWFIWPEFDIGGRGGVRQSEISTMFLQVSLVSEEQLLGKPYRTWFWRKQSWQ